MIIRKAVREDISELNELLTLLIQDERKYDKNINPDFEVTEMYENYVDDDNSCLLLAEDDNKHIVGYLFGYLVNEGDVNINKVSKLDAMFVREEFRRQDIGSSLVERFKEWSKDKGVKYIELNVCTRNDIAKILYDRQDFKLVAEVLKYEI